MYFLDFQQGDPLFHFWDFQKGGPDPPAPPESATDVGLCIYDNLCMYVRMYESMYAMILYNSSIIMQCYHRPLSFTDERRTTVCLMPGYHPTLLFCLPTFLPPVSMVAAKKSHFCTEKSGLAQNHRGNDSSLNCDNGRTNPLMNRSLDTQQQPTCDRLLEQ